MAYTDLDDMAGPSLIEMTPEPSPRGRELTTLSTDDLNKLSAIHFAPIVAMRCDVKRDQAEVLRRIREVATLGADDFYYSFPVKTKTGRDYIEGISIDGAQAVMQAYGNCDVDCRPVDIGHSWIFLARFIDLERGTSLVRPFIQPKGQSRLGGADDVRRMQIDFANGASKATRNVISNAIRPFTNYCFEAAKNDLIKRVGANLDTNRQAVLRNLDKLGVSLKRVEALLGRVAADWTAREVAALIVQIKSVQQGLATPGDIWPTGEAPPEPRRTAEQPSQPAEPTPPHDTVQQDSGTASTDMDKIGEQQAREVRSWAVGDVVGQDAILLRLQDLIASATSDADIDAIEEINADRIAKITGNPAASWRQLVRDRRAELTKPSP